MNTPLRLPIIYIDAVYVTVLLTGKSSITKAAQVGVAMLDVHRQSGRII